VIGRITRILRRAFDNSNFFRAFSLKLASGVALARRSVARHRQANATPLAA
jgi:hypothetical protein